MQKKLKFMNAADRVRQCCADVAIYGRKNAKFPWTTPFVSMNCLFGFWSSLRAGEESERVESKSDPDGVSLLGAKLAAC